MSELEPITPVPPARRRPRRSPWITAGIGALLAAALLGIAFLANSDAAANLVREWLIAKLETATGGRVEIASFHWRPFALQAEADGLILHGLEARGEAPYARVDHLSVEFSILGFLSPRIQLRDMEIDRPALHLIVYPDGSTNQPRPGKGRKPGKPALDTFFDLKAGHVGVRQGTLDYENRAAAFDFQNRLKPLNLAASDVALRLMYVPADTAPPADRSSTPGWKDGKNPEFYRIELGARDMNFTRGDASHPIAPRVSGFVQATLDLTRSAAYLRTLRLTASSKDAGERSIVVSGALTDFTRPHWQAAAQGELDMRLLEPTTGYPFAPQGIARLDITAQGDDGLFRVDGGIHADGASYIGTGVTARDVQLDARVHADPEQLIISSIVARLHQGGQLEGTVALDHWLPPIPGSTVLQAAPPQPVRRSRSARNQTQIKPPQPPEPSGPITIPVNGKVTALLKDVPLDAILDMVSQPPFQRLGLDTRLSGPAEATWIKGDSNTLAVSAALNASPSGHAVPGEAPVTGTIDGTYTQRDGAVALRALNITLPSSHIEAHGHLGAYPLTSPSEIAVDFHSHDLREFDTVLRDLGLQQGGKSGTAALPVSLDGQADIQATWTGSLVSPHIAGNLKATSLTLEIPPQTGVTTGKPQPVHWDAVEATGSFSTSRIAIDHAQLRHGPATLDVEGTLTAAGPPAPAAILAFDSNSLLHVRVNAAQIGLDELLPLVGQNLPLSGRLSAQIVADGPVHALDGAGWVQLDDGAVYGEPVSRIRAQGKIAGQVLQLASVTVNDQAGKLSASGSYNLKSRQFQIDAQGTGIDMAQVRYIRQFGMAATGKLAFTVTGSGTPDDPRIQGRGTLSGVTLRGEQLGNVVISAHTAGHALIYDLTSHFETAAIAAHGQTTMSGDYATQATLNFSHFNIGAPLRMAQIPGLTGDSSLAGTVTVDGPLARPAELRGEARLQELAMTIAGVHLHSEGPVHATLANERINLDPLHIMGEETDIRGQGSIDFNARRQVDMAASGSINLKLIETLDPDLTASGITTFQVQAHGTLQNPGLTGRIDFQNAALALEDLPNSLSQLHGTLVFNQNRLEVKSLTAMTGGGQLSVSGYLAYQRGIFADLTATGKGIRIRYPQGVSSLADATLQLQGTRNSLLLSGNAMITRFTVSPDMDFAALAAQAGKVQPIAPPDAPSNHVRLDVHIQSSPQLNFQNAYAKLAGDVDLHLRGTLATPSLLGRISITEGSATIAGTRYDLQRGDITFTNPVRIEPSIDLNATARVQDYDITLGLHGLPSNMAVTYRSDPPLPEGDVVALLALGRTQDQERIYTQQQEQITSNPATDALLGGALNATVSSRVQKLFGAGSVKVDPNYLGVLGNSTTRITVEEQLGRNLTLTYATDVDTTAQQLLQAEIAINRHVSLLVARDESGVFSMVVKATRRYR
ncbi:MAG: translocation/assembly module TamB domain-containing protein [Acidobacteriota bacterium]|nr:translocation/assembly module TamB domain-containing protein [Acidobacteriota bacterium]